MGKTNKLERINKGQKFNQRAKNEVLLMVIRKTVKPDFNFISSDLDTVKGFQLVGFLTNDIFQRKLSFMYLRRKS